MAENSKIEWTDSSWNPIRGCSRVSEGCVNCYAEGIAARFSGPGQPYERLAKRMGGAPRWTGDVRFIESALTAPLRWKRPRKIFVNSMSDLFHEKVPDEWIDKIFAVMAIAHWHTFQILTKRPERMRQYCGSDEVLGRVVSLINEWAHEFASVEVRHKPDGLRGLILLNIWLGVSVEDQATADERIPLLMQTPAAVRFISAEPLLGPLTISYLEWARLDWVICGGESGAKARPMHPAWARGLRNQCHKLGIPFFFKQWGEWAPVEEPASEEAESFELEDRYQFIDGCHFVKVGKKAAGRLLDDKEHNGFPETQAPAMATAA